MSWQCVVQIATYSYGIHAFRAGTLLRDIGLMKLYAVLENTGYFAYGVGFWLLCFKYWQTSFELNFLFMMRNDERSIKHNRIFLVMNCAVIGIGLGSMLLASLGLYQNNKKLKASGYYLGYFMNWVICIVYIDSRRRMENAIKQIPVLERSEKVFWICCLKYSLFIIAMSFMLYLEAKTNFGVPENYAAT